MPSFSPPSIERSPPPPREGRRAPRPPKTCMQQLLFPPSNSSFSQLLICFLSLEFKPMLPLTANPSPCSHVSVRFFQVKHPAPFPFLSSHISDLSLATSLPLPEHLCATLSAPPCGSPPSRLPSSASRRRLGPSPRVSSTWRLWCCSSVLPSPWGPLGFPLVLISARLGRWINSGWRLRSCQSIFAIKQLLSLRRVAVLMGYTGSLMLFEMPHLSFFLLEPKFCLKNPP